MNREPITREEIENLLKLLAPFAPYMTEELWSRIAPTSPRGLRPRSRGARIRDKESADQNTNSIHLADWPKHREELARQDKVVLVVQVNGKVRDRIEVERGLSQADATQLVLKSKNVSKFLGGKAAEKVVYVPDRIINVVV